MRLLVVGHGRMGRLVERRTRPRYGFEVAGVLDRAANAGGAGRHRRALPRRRRGGRLLDRRGDARHGAAPRRAGRVARGRHDRLAGARGRAARGGRRAPASAPSSPRTSRSAANLLDALAEAAARLLAGAEQLRRLHPRGAPRGQEGRALGHGAHAAARRSSAAASRGRSTCRRPAPARSRARTRSASTGRRRRSTLMHTVRDRATFAHGALAAARWVAGTKGWFTMRDVLGIGYGLQEETMRTPFTGCGTALVTPFTSSGAVDEAGGPPPGAAADRRGHPLPRAVRHDRRGADALGGRAAPRGRARGRGGARAACPCSPAPAATTRARSSRRRARCTRPGPTACSRSRPTTTSPRRRASSATTRRSPRRRRSRSWSTTCRGGPAATSTRRRSSRLATIPHVVGVKEASGNMTQICEVLKAVAAGLPRPLGRRRAHAAGDGGRRPRRHLGGLERGAGRDGAARGGGRARTTSPPPARSTRACCR